MNNSIVYITSLAEAPESGSALLPQISLFEYAQVNIRAILAPSLWILNMNKEVIVAFGYGVMMRIPLERKCHFEDRIIIHL